MGFWKRIAVGLPATIGLLAWQVTGVDAATVPADTVQNPDTQNAQDLGPASPGETITASLILKVQNEQGLENYIQQTETPGNPNYHKFLTTSQFADEYAPSPQVIEQITGYVEQLGLHVDQVDADGLDMQISGTVAQFDNALNTTIDNFRAGGREFRAPKHIPHIPNVLLNSVLAVVGLDTEQAAQSLTVKTPNVQGAPSPKVVLPQSGSTATNTPGSYTVGDTANMYDINPLYQKGITGKGETVGIVTLSDFNPSDAYTYWSTIGLKTPANRIREVQVDGGGQIDSGSDETTLDVEQAGGIAPDANIVVYDAPNTDAGFIDAFYQAVSDNVADSLSVSWGQPEIDYLAAMNNGVDYTDELAAFNQAFMEAAAQGISMFAAAGDSGAYDTARDFPPSDGFTTPLTVDFPASDPYITAAGGTTVPFSANFSLGSVKIQKERPWAWDYLQNLGYTGLFPIGTGGGVSVIWPRPWYQMGISGMQNSAPGQAFTDSQGLLFGTPFTYQLPANFAGRNVSDLSMDADPETGYLVYDSADGGWIAGYGGTSFVAPQLNGIAALVDQFTGSRVGFMNPMLYDLQRTVGYGPNKPFNDLKDGSTNWYYQAVPGYDPATGIGTPNVANLATALALLH
ncbi:Pro-kumamolisin, activation domain [Alicyclobacillus hesperidum]|uniref:Pro-kumamolisin, activation domain n=1 Tax=Alicyclobacillus hesperidum TaxID=89784 RepID=A0A1H2TUB4_9BACL|nr:S53 family peptidase [Alicyclobacillus hesperidum]SDW47440.1 Pro-kumamolisin, activation domain [Alicyclobacillus hesperidum]